MATVFSSIIWRSKPRTQRPTVTSHRASSSAELDADTVAAQSEEPDLKDLNNALRALVEIFPDVQPEVFREMLSSFGAESRLQIVTESLLKHDMKWIRGRYRDRTAKKSGTAVSEKDQSGTIKQEAVPPKAPKEEALLPSEERFRSRQYRATVTGTLSQEFRGLSRSAIKAVLAEHNWSYTHARPNLIDLASRSWKYTLTNFFTGRRGPSAKDHPLVEWQTPSSGPPVPHLTYTNSVELNAELHRTLIAPILAQQRLDQIRADQTLAVTLNDAEAEEANATFDCECCFVPSAFEATSFCTTIGHYICHSCIRRTTSEALYGQGWSRSISVENSTLRCIAAGDCEGCIPLESVRRAYTLESDGHTTFAKLEERCAREGLLKSDLPLVKCPFCPYAEVDGIALTLRTRNLWSWPFRFRRSPLFIFTLFPLIQILMIPLFWLLFKLLALFAFLFLTVNYLLPMSHQAPLFPALKDSLARIARRRRGLKWTCASLGCQRSSCLACSVEWVDIHTCHEAPRLALRTAVERAMAEAVKRTCPNCNLSFVKSEGCNKLTCPCGYQMCYVCRQRIGSESYGHFCQHFRAQPGTGCAECDKCDLYRTENEDAMLMKAKARAEQEWLKQQEEENAEWVVGTDAGRLSVSGKGFWEIKTWEEWLDWVVDAVVA